MQDTNLKVSPYFDDFDRSKNYQKVLFKPGYSVQTRELNTIQSILQNQIERFGQHVFKDGSVIIPGNVGYNLQYDAVLVQNLINGISVENYRRSLVGKTITGLSSGVKAIILDTLSQTESEKNTITLYVKYISGGFFEEGIQFSKFKNNEILVDTENTPVSVTTVQNSTSYSGSIAFINPGVYFIRGFFVEVGAQRIILDQYSNTPSYKVGLIISESIVTSEDDETLFDNALGSTNYSAPGADRLKISTTLTKQNLLLTDDSNFIELLRLEDGNVVKMVEYTAYNELEKSLARRTFDESGSYTTQPYTVRIREALSDGENNGVYLPNQVLLDGTQILDRDPTAEESEYAINGKDYYALEISEGKAYVKGFEIINSKKQYVVVEKPRKSSKLNNQGIFLNIGSYLKLDSSQSLYGNVNFKDSLVLKDSDNEVIGKATCLGLAFGYNLYVTNVSIYTKITLSTVSHGIVIGDFIGGVLSGAVGVVDSVNGSIITLRQVTGTFTSSEPISNSRLDYGTVPTITSIDIFKFEDVRKVEKIVNSSSVFSAFIKLDSVTISGSSFTVSGNSLTGVGTNFSADLSTKSKLRIGSTDVEIMFLTPSNVTLNTTPVVSAGTYYNVSKLICRLYSSNNGLTVLASSSPVKSLSDISYDILVSETKTVSGGSFTISRQSNEYPDASTLIITSSTSILTPSSVTQTTENSISVSGLSGSLSSVNVYYKLRLGNGAPRSKEKISFQKLIVDLQKSSTNTIYGTRLGDKELSLKFPDVYKLHAIHEALTPGESNENMFDTIKLNTNQDIQPGHVIIHGNIRAKIIHVNSDNLKVKYISDSKFPSGANLAITVDIPGVESGRFVTESSYGRFKDITNNFTLVKNDTEDFYRVSKLVRRLNKPAPSNKIIVIFDYLKHDNLNNAFYTADSYENIDYSEIPNSYNLNSYGDIIDFRYYITPSSSGSGTLTSPHRETVSALDYANNQILTSTQFAYPQKLLSSDTEFYLGRIDKLYLSETGHATVTKGSDSLTPKVPNDENTSLLLSTIKLPAYLKNVFDATITLEKTRGYTMKDIGKLDQRISNVETYTSLNLLEVNTNNLNILDDEGRNRFKNGFVVDKFNTTTIADLSNPDYSASIDTTECLVRPYPYVNNVSFDYNANESGTSKTGKLITLPYKEVEFISQPYSSRVENLNPFEVVTWVGNISLEPKKDIWYDTVRILREAQTIDIEGPIRFLFDNSGAAGDQWGQWTQTGSQRVGRGTNVFEQRTGVNNSLITTQQTIETGDTINSITDERFVRSIVIDITANSLKPNTRFNLHINEIDSNSNFYPKLITGIQNVNRRFVVGERVIITPIFDDNSARPQVITGITATVVSPYQYVNDSTIIGTNFVPNPSTQSLEYSQTTTILAIDNISGLEEISSEGLSSNILNPGLIGSKFTITGLTSLATGTCSNKPDVVSNVTGNIDAFVLIPPNTFETGILTFTVSDRNDNVVATGFSQSNATTSYLSQGTSVNVSSSIVSVSVPEVVATPISEPRTRFIPDPPPPPPPARRAAPPASARRVDPIAQSFFIDNEDGIFVTSIDLYFYTKDETVPVTLDIRTVENGTPTQTIVPYATSTVQSSNVRISTDSSLPTKFTFESPVYLSSQQDYCFVVRSSSLDYYLWVSRLGETDVTTRYIIDKQPYIGVLFKSANMSTWTPDQYEDVKFTLNRAKFDTGITKTGVLYNKPITRVKLSGDSLRLTEDSTLIKVLQPNHGMHSTQNFVRISGVVSDVSNAILSGQINNNTTTITLNDITGSSLNFSSISTWSKSNNQNISQTNLGYMKIGDEIISYSAINNNNQFVIYERGSLGTTVSPHSPNSIVQCYMLNGIPLSEINTTHNVLNVFSLDEYLINTRSKSNSTVFAGGNTISATRNIQYEIITPNINVLSLPNTNSNLSLTSTSATSIGNSRQTSYNIISGESIENYAENDLNSPRMVASVTNENRYLSGPGRSLKLLVNMSTSTDTLSPVLDLEGSSITTITNRINKEIDSNGNIDISSELLPVGGLHSSYITKKVVLENSSTSIRVLFESIRKQDVDIKVFAKIRSDSMLGSFNDCTYIELPAESYPVSQTDTEYGSFEYEIKGLDEFKEWSIKVVMIGNDQSNIPKIRNFRAIALAI
jgi:hypothetical protein